MNRFGFTSLCLVAALLLPRVAAATKSAELYTTTSYPYGRFEARMRVTAGDGIVSAFFLWKDKSEQSGVFWNELDYEKINANCTLQTNALYGNPSANHTTKPTVSGDLCADFHVYTYEWTPDTITWLLDGNQLRQETGATAAAYADNAGTQGMQLHFNIWPGDSSFGGNFNPSSLPVHQYIDWVQYSAYKDGAFTLSWREDFDAATLPTGWATGDWGSPKNLSTHDPLNVNFLGGWAVLSMTADNATGPAGAMSGPGGGSGGMMGAGGASGSGGKGGGGAGAGTGGSSAGAGTGGAAGTAGMPNPGSGGMTAAGGSSGSTAAGGAGGTAITTGGTGAASAAGGTGAASAAGGTGAASATGGTGAVGGGSAGTSSTGGAGGAQTSGSGATGGAASGGTSTTGGTSGAGAPGAMSGGAGGTGAAGGDSGCGCRVPRSQQRSSPGIGAALVFALAVALRRRCVSRPEARAPRGWSS